MNYRRFINQLPLDIIKSMRQLEKDKYKNMLTKSFLYCLIKYVLTKKCCPPPLIYIYIFTSRAEELISRKVDTRTTYLLLMTFCPMEPKNCKHPCLGLNKGCVSKFSVNSRVRQEAPEEGRKTHRPNRCDFKNKDEDNSPKILNKKKEYLIRYNSVQINDYFRHIKKC